MASIKYYPASRVKTNLKTTGNLYRLNGKPYKGSYYVTFDGRAYTGANPATGPNELLIPADADRAIGSSQLFDRTSKFAAYYGETIGFRENRQIVKAEQSTELKQLVSYNAQPLESDYTTGYFTRYFAKRVNMNSYIIEISYNDWTTIINGNDPFYEAYEAIDLFWQIKGPRHDRRVSQYQIIGGVYDTNKRVVEGKAKGFNGLIAYIGDDYTKFARIVE